MKPWIYVAVEFLSADEGGRKTPVYLKRESVGSYRPHFRVIGDTEYLGVQFIEGSEGIIKPKEKATVKVLLLYHPNVSYEIK